MCQLTHFVAILGQSYLALCASVCWLLVGTLSASKTWACQLWEQRDTSCNSLFIWEELLCMRQLNSQSPSPSTDIKMLDETGRTKSVLEKLPEGPSELHPRDPCPKPRAVGRAVPGSWPYSQGLGCRAGDGAKLPPGLRGALPVPWGLGASTWGDGNHHALAPAVFGHAGNFVVGISPPFCARGILVAGEARGQREGTSNCNTLGENDI